MLTNTSWTRRPLLLHPSSSGNYRTSNRNYRTRSELRQGTARLSDGSSKRLRSVAIMVGGTSSQDLSKFDGSVLIPSTVASPWRFDPRLDDEELWRRKGVIYSQSLGRVTYRDLICALKDGTLWSKFTRDQVCLYLASAPLFTTNQPGLVHEFLYDSSQETGTLPSTFVNIGNDSMRQKLDFYATNSQLTARYVSDFWASTTVPSYGEDQPLVRSNGKTPFNTPRFDCVAVTEDAYDHLVTVHLKQKASGRRNLALAESLFGIQAIRDKSATFLIYTIPNPVATAAESSPAAVTVSPVIASTQTSSSYSTSSRVPLESDTEPAANGTSTTTRGDFIPKGTLVVGGVFYDAAQYYKRQVHLSHCSPKNYYLYACRSVHHGLSSQQAGAAPMGNTWQSIMDQLNVRLETVVCIQCLLWGKTKPNNHAAWMVPTTSARNSASSASFTELPTNYRRLEAWYRAHMHYAECQQHGLWKRGVGYVTFEFRRDRAQDSAGSGTQFMLPYARLVPIKDPATGNELVQRLTANGPPCDPLVLEMRSEHCFLTRDGQAMLSYLFKFTNSSFSVLSPTNYIDLRNFFAAMTMAGVHYPGAAGNRGNAAWAGDLAALHGHVRQISDQLVTINDKLGVDSNISAEVIPCSKMLSTLSENTQTLQNLVTTLIHSQHTGMRQLPTDSTESTVSLTAITSIAGASATGESSPPAIVNESVAVKLPTAATRPAKERPIAEQTVTDLPVPSDSSHKKDQKPKLVRKRKAVSRDSSNKNTDHPRTTRSDSNADETTQALVKATSATLPMGPPATPTELKKSSRKCGRPRASPSSSQKFVAGQLQNENKTESNSSGKRRRTNQKKAITFSDSASSSSSSSVPVTIAPISSKALINNRLASPLASNQCQQPHQQQHVPDESQRQLKPLPPFTDVFSGYELKQNNHDAIAADTISNQLLLAADPIATGQAVQGTTDTYQPQTITDYRSGNDFHGLSPAQIYTPAQPPAAFTFHSRFEDNRAVNDLLECSGADTDQTVAGNSWSEYCTLAPVSYTPQFHNTDMQNETAPTPAAAGPSESNLQQLDSFRLHYIENGTIDPTCAQNDASDKYNRIERHNYHQQPESTLYPQSITGRGFSPRAQAQEQGNNRNLIHPWLEGVALRVEDDEVMDLEEAAEGGKTSLPGDLKRRPCSDGREANHDISNCLFVDSISSAVQDPGALLTAVTATDTIPSASDISCHLPLLPSSSSPLTQVDNLKTALPDTEEEGSLSTSVLATKERPGHITGPVDAILEDSTQTDNDNDEFLSDFDDREEDSNRNSGGTLLSLNSDHFNERDNTQFANYENTFEYQQKGKNNLWLLPPASCGGSNDNVVCKFSELPTNQGYIDDVLISLLTHPSTRSGVCRCSSAQRCTPVCFYDYFIKKEITNGVRKRVKNALAREPFVFVHENVQLWGPNRRNYFCSLQSTPAPQVTAATTGQVAPTEHKLLATNHCPSLVSLEHPHIWLHVVSASCGHRLPICVGCVVTKAIPDTCVEPGCEKPIDQLFVVSVGAQCGCGVNLIYTGKPLTISAVENTPLGGRLFKPSVANTVFAGGTIWTRQKPTLYLDCWRLTCDTDGSTCIPATNTAQIGKHMSITTTIESVMTWKFDEVSFKDKVTRCWASRCDPEYVKKKMEKVVSH